MDILREISFYLSANDIKSFKSTTYEIQYFIEKVEEEKYYWTEKILRTFEIKLTLKAVDTNFSSKLYEAIEKKDTKRIIELYLDLPEYNQLNDYDFANIIVGLWDVFGSTKKDWFYSLTLNKNGYVYSKTIATHSLTDATLKYSIYDTPNLGAAFFENSAKLDVLLMIENKSFNLTNNYSHLSQVFVASCGSSNLQLLKDLLELDPEMINQKISHTYSYPTDYADQTSTRTYSAVGQALKSGSEEVLKFLIDNGGVIDAKDIKLDNRKVLMYLITNFPELIEEKLGGLETIKYPTEYIKYLEVSKIRNETLNSELLELATLDEVKTLREKYGLKFETIALQRALVKNDPKVINYLIEKKVPVDTGKYERSRTLIKALEAKNDKAVKYILSFSNYEVNGGAVALSILNDDLKIFKELMKRKIVDPDITYGKKYTNAWTAAVRKYYSNKEYMKVILADPAFNRSITLAFKEVSQPEGLEILKFILANGKLNKTIIFEALDSYFRKLRTADASKKENILKAIELLIKHQKADLKPMKKPDIDLYRTANKFKLNEVIALLDKYKK